MPFGSSADVSAFKFLFLLAVAYGLMSALAYSVIHMAFVHPLGNDAPLDRFSEARTVEHVRMLSQEIDGRQEGRPGLKKAAQYIKGQLDAIKDRASSNVRIDVEETTVSGSFNMLFLGFNIGLGYRNHTNILMRISSVDSKDTDPSVLVNGHFDSPLGSPGAGDCGSCVASMLEIARLIVDSGWAPYRPIIFLFNGAEELFMLGSHGFMKTHKWRDTIGAFINVEASGTGGPDLVCQSGPSSWPSNVYAEAAIYPMANSAAQDVFPIIPGDTDFRIFSQDYGNIPGLDIIFLLGGYFYHTSYDTVERLIPGSIQARGENLFSIIKTFTNSSKLQNSYQTNSSEVINSTFNDERAVFFDYFSWFMIFYSKRVAKILHSIPIFFFLVISFTHGGSHSWSAALCDFIKGLLFHAIGIILAIIVPVVFSIFRLLFSSQTMNWFAHPYLAFLMFIPCALIGLLIPRIIWRCFPLSQDVSIVKSSKEALSDEARFWGAFGFYAVLTLAYLVAGLSGGFVTFFVCASMLPAWISFCLSVKSFGQRSLRSTMFYILPLVPCLAYSVYFGGILAQFLIEKMGMMGSLPPPYGHYVPDVIVAALIGIVTGWCTGPLMPICGHWLARSSIVQFLLHLSVFALALSSQFFPYTMSAPKRIVFQHTFHTEGSSQIRESTYDFSVTDSNSLLFLFKYSPEVAKELNITSEFSFESASLFKRNDWMAIFPVSFLFSNSLKFPAERDDILKQYEFFPKLSVQNPSLNSEKGPRRVHLELYLGSLEEVWVAVLNITGPLSSWSFADNLLPGTETYGGGPQSYICRLSGPSDGNWTFWLEANSSEALRVDLAVLDQKLVSPAKRLKDLFPDWVDVVAYSSYMSSYIF
ncbi:endoplasmic reticulum metallopeptidase 1 isoform X1 [Cajanus cajan]|uniref:Endoplasmic reticulum metallopeptidase 1 n=1 Tax=Cajanus cajan TaxID=3821 RepID=A0A151SDU7_CAJCA|nr:endoplasmic reticulum metallopeptidase 1 isoform X1 [Cajanus cajan]KYP52953.1 Endoplasmic reticulum metallopeptidase 1 [Cajanus cajan]